MQTDNNPNMSALPSFNTREELYRLIDEGLRDIEQGRVIPAEEVFAELERDLENGTL